MAAEEVGARLVAYGEEEFVTAFRDCQKSIDQYAASIATADKKTQTAAAGMDTAKKKFTIFGQSLTDIKSGFEMAFGAFEKGYGFIKTFIDAASNMNETTSKSSVVFGEMAGAVEDMGSRAAQSMGLSKQEAIAAAATYGNLFVSMGMAKDVSADMSMNLVQLAADFASFNNIPVADALDKIRAGLVGESEPLKSLGVNINEASLKQEALSLGLIKGNEALSASAKAQAAYSLMLKQSTTAQGDFARTADGIANQQRILEAQTKDLTAAIGQQLLPVWKEMLKVINQSASTLNLLMTRDQQLQDVLQDHSQQVALNTTNYKDYIKEMTRAANVAGFGVNANGDLTKSYKTWYGVVTEVVQAQALLTEAQINDIQASKKMEQALKDTRAAAEVTAAGFDEFSSSLGANTQNATWNKAALDTVALSQVTLETGLTRVNTLMTAYTTQLMFNKAAAGLDADQTFILAERMGLIDQTTQIAMGALDKFKTELNEGKTSASEYAGKVSELDKYIRGLQSKEITLTTYYKEIHQGTYLPPAVEGSVYQHASGGSFMIPPGYPNDSYPLGMGHFAQSGEQVVILPKTMSAPPSTYNYSTANNYNLNVMTSQSPAVVQQSFAMMKLLAG